MGLLSLRCFTASLIVTITFWWTLPCNSSILLFYNCLFTFILPPLDKLSLKKPEISSLIILSLGPWCHPRSLINTLHKYMRITIQQRINLCFFLFWAAPVAYGSSQARGQIGTTAMGSTPQPQQHGI